MTNFKLLDSDLDYIIGLVDQAGAAIMIIYQDLNAFAEGQTTKVDRSPLTQADLVANQILVKGLKDRWSAIPILSEEGADSFDIDEELKYYWAVDPLDGTKEFIKRNDEFTLNVALIHMGIPILGIVFAPALDSMYLGYRDQDSRSLKDRPIAKKRSQCKWQQITVSSENLSNLKRPVKIVASRSHSSLELQNWLQQYPNHELLEVGSSLKFCYVAEGRADQYPRLGPTCIWDTAAGHAVVIAAGGIVRGIDRVNLSYSNPNQLTNPSFIASNK
jgi:3'(2'), 5'-bisphosphate nucleotidase